MRLAEDLDLARTHWQTDAACSAAGDALFFPKGGDTNSGFYNEARRLCNSCPVAVQCLEYAIETDERHGMWGGTTPQQRDQIRKKRGMVRANRRHGAERPHEARTRKA